MKQYLLIQPDEDGNPLRFLSDEKLNEILEDPESYGVEKFLEELPPNQDPNYWTDGSAMLLKIEVLKPRVVASKFSL